MEELIKSYRKIKGFELQLKDAGKMSIKKYQKLLKNYKTELDKYNIYYSEFEKMINFIDETIQI